MRAYYKLHHSINDGINGYNRLHFSFFCVSSLSVLYPGRRSEKHSQSFDKNPINSLACSAKHHYCDVSKHSKWSWILPFLNLIGDQRIGQCQPNFFYYVSPDPLHIVSGDETSMVVRLSVSQRACDKVYLNGHIRSLDWAYHGKHVPKFTWMVI